MSTKDEIPASSIILEPLLVASLLIGSALISRRRSSQLRDIRNLSPLSPPTRSRSTSPIPSLGSDRDADTAKETAHRRSVGSSTNMPLAEMRFFRWTMRIPDNSIYASRIFSRFLMRFPFILEIWYWLLTYWIYQIARACQALTMGDQTRVLAEIHSRQILWLEQALHIDIELGLQRLVMRSDTLLWLFNKTYAMVHIPATITFMGYSFMYFPAPAFQSTRRTLVFSNFLAFVIFSLWPCMPPRLLPKDMGYIDTVHSNGEASAWTTNRFQNQMAAFPSLHFGYSSIIGLSIIAYSPHRWLKIVGPMYPVLILLVIMATANHYIIDAIGGLFVTIVAYRFNRLFLNLRPLEEYFFWFIRTERPMDETKFQDILGRVEGGGDGVNRPLMAGEEV